jgi:hypothetical protein
MGMRILLFHGILFCSSISEFNETICFIRLVERILFGHVGVHRELDETLSQEDKECTSVIEQCNNIKVYVTLKNHFLSVKRGRVLLW